MIPHLKSPIEKLGEEIVELVPGQTDFFFNRCRTSQGKRSVSLSGNVTVGETISGMIKGRENRRDVKRCGLGRLSTNERVQRHFNHGSNRKNKLFDQKWNKQIGAQHGQSAKCFATVLQGSFAAHRHEDTFFETMNKLADLVIG